MNLRDEVEKIKAEGYSEANAESNDDGTVTFVVYVPKNR